VSVRLDDKRILNANLHEKGIWRPKIWWSPI